MSVRRLAETQPTSFAFTRENLEWSKGQIAKYPEGCQASAVIPLLWKAQEQNGGWLPEPAIRAVAEMLDMAYIRVLEVATFYTMFALEPVGKHFVQICGTTPCLLRGADKLMHICEKKIGHQHEVSADGQLSWLEVECLGSCANAPMAQINYDYFEDLTPENFEKLLDDLRADRKVKPGPQVDRTGSAPVGGPTSLTDASLYDGSVVGAWKKGFEDRKKAKAAAAAQAATEAAKPKEGGSGEKQAADSPGARDAKGQTPVKNGDQAKAAEKSGGPSVVQDTAKAPAKGDGLKAVPGKGDKDET
jgi:NADH-quinone oxidoreductase subunit E